MASGVFFTGRLLGSRGPRRFFGLSFSNFPERPPRLGRLVRRRWVNRPRDFPECHSSGGLLYRIFKERRRLEPPDVAADT